MCSLIFERWQQTNKTSHTIRFSALCREFWAIETVDRVACVCSKKAVCYMAKTLKPPSTTATVPVTKAAASLIR